MKIPLINNPNVYYFSSKYENIILAEKFHHDMNSFNVFYSPLLGYMLALTPRVSISLSTGTVSE